MPVMLLLLLLLVFRLPLLLVLLLVLQFPLLLLLLIFSTIRRDAHAARTLERRGRQPR